MVSRVHRYPLIVEPVEVPTPSPRVLLLGTCGVEPLVRGLQNRGVVVDHLLWESLHQAPQPEFDESSFDAIVVSVTLAHIIVEAAAILEPERAFGNALYLPRAIALGRTRELLDACTAAIQTRLAAIMPRCARKPTFFLSFLEPKHNYLGNLMPRYDLNNPGYFVQKLNEALAETIATQADTHFLDVNELFNLIGRARLQDDYTTALSHGSIMVNDDSDIARIQPSKPPWELWETAEALSEFEQVLAQRLLDDLEILRAPLQIKAIIVDVDDTLWRGIAVEEAHKPHWEFTEGWPVGVAEALLFFKARGGLLAMCSKNDEAALRARWPEIYHGRFRLADFASTKINFKHKSDNIREILAEFNLLPSNVLFLDDNPREIDEVRNAFPDMHFLSSEHQDWRRKILMLPKMQSASRNADTALRTASIQANAVRESTRGGLSFEAWLSSLQLKQYISLIESAADPRFDRAFELINKTNQFNTTGQRWSRVEMTEFLETGGRLFCSSLRDKFADNGMVSVIAVKDDEIVQAVLSCRAFKYSVEIAAGRIAIDFILKKHRKVKGRLIDTGRNASCHRYFADLGFEKRDDLWVGIASPAVPDHLSVEFNSNH